MAIPKELPAKMVKQGNPALEVSLLKPEEAEQYMRVRHEVFRSTVNKILYSRGEPSQKTLDRVTEEIRDGVANKGILYLKCVDIATGEIVAGARWRHVKPADPNATERTWEEVEESFKRTEPYDESDPDLFHALHDLFSENKREILGARSHYVLDTLVTLPQHERKGAGSMLVRWGTQRADEAGVEAYLEASPMGAPMYARHGYEPMKKVALDLTKYGGNEVLEFILMRGPPTQRLRHHESVYYVGSPAFVSSIKTAYSRTAYHDKRPGSLLFPFDSTTDSTSMGYGPLDIERSCLPLVCSEQFFQRAIRFWRDQLGIDFVLGTVFIGSRSLSNSVEQWL